MYWDNVGGALYECEIQMIDGEAHLISSHEVVQVTQLGFYQIYTQDFLFV